MCEICLQFRCPAACPSYGHERYKPTNRRWKFRQEAWVLLERSNEKTRENSKESRMNKEEGKEKEENT